MYRQIDSNKRLSWILIASFILIIIGLGYLLSLYVQNGQNIVYIAIAISLIMSLIGYYQGSSLILTSVGAKAIEKKDDPELYRIVENLAITSGIPTPKIYIIPDPAYNAFATGRTPETAVVAITAGLRQVLNQAELEAVMGHELSHIKNFDIRIMMLTSVLLGVVVLITDIMWRSSLAGRRDRKSNPLILVAVILALVAAPIVGQLIKLAVSRKREFLADASSVMLTRYPQAMISALQKISQAPTIAGHHNAIAHMFIYSPLKANSTAAKLFSTHPPISERIDAIKKGYNMPV